MKSSTQNPKTKGTLQKWTCTA